MQRREENLMLHEVHSILFYTKVE